MTDPTDLNTTDDLERLALLAEPVRRRVYEHAALSLEPVDRDASAAAAGISRSLAAFHLDRLVDGGLLAATFRRRSGKTGPGAGRPAKFYRRPTGAAIAVSLPPRRYSLAARIFATGLDRARGGGKAVRAAARQVGREAAKTVPKRVRARDAAGARTALLELLRERGFEPREAADGGIDLGNCPFRDLTVEHRDLTCGANLALLGGIVDAFAAAGLAVERREPAEPCCVALRPVAVAPTLDAQTPGLEPAEVERA